MPANPELLSFTKMLGDVISQKFEESIFDGLLYVTLSILPLIAYISICIFSRKNAHVWRAAEYASYAAIVSIVILCAHYIDYMPSRGYVAQWDAWAIVYAFPHYALVISTMVFIVVFLVAKFYFSHFKKQK